MATWLAPTATPEAAPPVPSIAAASVVGAFLLRFEYGIPAAERSHLWNGICLAVVVRVLVFRIAGCDRGGWRYAGVGDVYKLLLTNIVGSIIWCARSGMLP